MSDSIFNQRKTPTTPATPAAAPEKPIYRAAELDAPRVKVPRFKVIYKNGHIGLMSYAYLVEAICTSDQFLSLVFTSCIISLEGRNLTGIVDLLQEERVLALQYYNEQRFSTPADDEPVITDIKRQREAFSIE